MKHKKWTTHRVEIVDRITCDCCGKEYTNVLSGSNCARTEIQCQYGDNWPEGGCGEVISADVCQECFLAKVVPALEAAGIKVHKSDWD